MTKSKSKTVDLDAFEETLDALIEEAKKRKIPNARTGDLVHAKLAVAAMRKARKG